MYCKNCGHHVVEHGEKACNYMGLKSDGKYETCSCKCSYRDVRVQHSDVGCPEIHAESLGEVR